MKPAAGRIASGVRVPVHLVIGAPGSGKSALIARLLSERPAWIGFVNTQIVPELDSLRVAPRGCPCCTARVALQVALVRALRELRPQRALIEIDDPEHATRVLQVLGELPFSQAVSVGATLALPEALAVTPAELELPRGDRSDPDLR